MRPHDEYLNLNEPQYSHYDNNIHQQDESSEKNPSPPRHLEHEMSSHNPHIDDAHHSSRHYPSPRQYSSPQNQQPQNKRPYDHIPPNPLSKTMLPGELHNARSTNVLVVCSSTNSFSLVASFLAALFAPRFAHLRKDSHSQLHPPPRSPPPPRFILLRDPHPPSNSLNPRLPISLLAPSL